MSVLSILLTACAVSAQLVRSPAARVMAARPMCQRHMGKNAVVDRLALSAAKPVRQSVAVNAGWTRRALEIIGIRRNQGNKSGVRRTVDPNELTVVTGGGSGIGRAVALRLARRGMNVIITGRRGGPLEDTKALAAESGFTGEVIPVVADSTSEEGRQGVADAVSKLKEDKGFVLRGLIHNAAVNTPCKKMMDLDQDEWLKVSDINVNGPLFLTQKLYPYFGKTETDKNRVMMLSSVARTCSGLPAYGPYCVSKLSFYGLHLMFKEEMSKGVTPVYSASLIPGEVDTEMQRQTAYGQADGTFPEHLVQYWREIQESGQLLPPEVTGAFMEYVLIDTAPTEYGDDEWFIYDKKHHKDWAYEFPDVNIVEPQGLF